jgi:hypothetical protein
METLGIFCAGMLVGAVLAVSILFSSYLWILSKCKKETKKEFSPHSLP